MCIRVQGELDWSRRYTCRSVRCTVLTVEGVYWKGSVGSRGLAKKECSGLYSLLPDTELAAPAAKRRKLLQDC